MKNELLKVKRQEEKNNDIVTNQFLKITIQLILSFFIAATSCRGYLNKVGAKPLFSMRANTRWFVFDREKQMFVYYSDKSEKKPRGGAYFNAITDVYFDHSSAMKNNRTFIVKTKSRLYTLQAPSQQACSIWIDVSIQRNI